MIGRLLTTPRLTLEPLTRHHAADLFEIYRDLRNLGYWEWAAHRTAEETELLIADNLAMIGDCWWTVYTRNPREVIGRIKFIGATVPGMGYMIRADRRRQGYGAEAVRAALEEAFTHFGYNRLELWIDEANLPSQQLAAKTGFTRRGQFNQRRYAKPHETLVFGLRADEWAAQNGSTQTVATREIAFFGVAPVIPVQNVVETASFYSERLGFHIDYLMGNPTDFAIVSRGEWTTPRAEIHFRQYTGSVSPSPGTLYLRIGGAPVEVLCNEFRAKGVEIMQEPTMMPYGVKEFTLRDHNGWLLRLGGVE